MLSNDMSREYVLGVLISTLSQIKNRSEESMTLADALQNESNKEPDFYVNIAPDSWTPILRLIRDECRMRRLPASAGLMDEFIPVYIKMERLLKEQGLIRFSSVEQESRDQEREAKNDE